MKKRVLTLLLIGGIVPFAMGGNAMATHEYSEPNPHAPAFIPPPLPLQAAPPIDVPPVLLP